MIAGRAPTFEVRQLKSMPRWYVRVFWQHGQEEHVTGFISADDAQSWISRKSEGWLRSRTAALRSKNSTCEIGDFDSYTRSNTPMSFETNGCQ